MASVDGSKPCLQIFDSGGRESNTLAYYEMVTSTDMKCLVVKKVKMIKPLSIDQNDQNARSF
jgi:hypothetical protein